MAEYILGNAIGVDPLFTIIPISFFLFGLDQLTNKGAYFEIVYRKLFPEYEAKVIAHEAGHFLVSYILGVAVSECVTSALDAKNFPEIRGQAGTIFHDSRLADEMKTNKVTKASLDRLSVVLMAGIAAEGLMFGNAEGGVLDEEALFALYAPVRPPWNVLRIQAKARWAATQALLLIKEHRASYDALVEALSNGAGVGDCVRVIEDNLPKELPSTVRIQERERKKRDSELASVLGFVRRMTYKVGGIEAATAGDDANLAVNKDGTVNRRSDMGGSGGIESRGVVPTGGLLVADADSMEDGSEEVRSVDTISSRVEQLKDVTRTGKLDVTENEDGGIWLNNLDTLKNKQAINPVNVVDEETPADVMSTQGEVVSMEDLPQVAAELKEVPENVEGTVDAVLGNVGNAQDAEVSQNELENLPPQIMYKQIILPAPVDGYLDELEALNGTLTEEDREFLMNSGEANGELSGVTESDAADGAADAANAAMPEVQGEEDKPTESNVDMFGAASRNTPASRGETAVRSADATATEAERSASKEKYGAAVDLIQSGRGWQLKRLENEEAFNRKRVQEISARIASLEGRDQDGSVDAETKELASSGSKTETDSQ
jgi:anti-sigma28 factor (negative regulator of flagellin synthesis)